MEFFKWPSLETFYHSPWNYSLIISSVCDVLLRPWCDINWFCLTRSLPLAFCTLLFLCQKTTSPIWCSPGRPVKQKSPMGYKCQESTASNPTGSWRLAYPLGECHFGLISLNSSTFLCPSSFWETVHWLCNLACWWLFMILANNIEAKGIHLVHQSRLDHVFFF